MVNLMNYITKRKGGDGAFREFVDLIIKYINSLNHLTTRWNLTHLPDVLRDQRG